MIGPSSPVMKFPDVTDESQVSTQDYLSMRGRWTLQRETIAVAETNENGASMIIFFKS